MRGCSIFTEAIVQFAVIPSEVEESRDAASRYLRGISRLRFAPLGMTRRSVSHLLGHFDSEKIQAALQNAAREIAQGQPRTARRFFRFQHRASFVEGVEAVGQLEKIVRQNVRAKIVQHLRNALSKLAQTLGEANLS